MNCSWPTLLILCLILWKIRSHVKFIAHNILLDEIDYARGTCSFSLREDDEWLVCAYTFGNELCVKLFLAFHYQLNDSCFVVHLFGWNLLKVYSLSRVRRNQPFSSKVRDDLDVRNAILRQWKQTNSSPSLFGYLQTFETKEVCKTQSFHRKYLCYWNVFVTTYNPSDHRTTSTAWKNRLRRPEN